jgi:hypothetical protein
VSRIEAILRRHPERFGKILAAPEEFRLQVLLTLAPRGTSAIERSGFRVDAEYFYPASTIKLCGAVAALLTINSLATQHPGITIDTPMSIDPLLPGEPKDDQDPSNTQYGRITVRHQIRKVCIVSDNAAFNRLYELVGHSAMNDLMHGLGLRSVIINHRLSDARNLPDHQRTPRVVLHTRGGPFEVPARTSELVLRPPELPGIGVGRAHINAAGERVETPMDFSRKNRASLADLHELLIALARPELSSLRINLPAEQRAMLLEAMTIYPRESRNPTYDPAKFPDEHVKFLLPGLTRVVAQDSLRITSKVGFAYGFTIENAYVEGGLEHTPFFLTAVIYANQSGVLNADSYDEETVAKPFMADLAEAVAMDLW